MALYCDSNDCNYYDLKCIRNHLELFRSMVKMSLESDKILV